MLATLTIYNVSVIVPPAITVLKVQQLTRTILLLSPIGYFNVVCFHLCYNSYFNQPNLSASLKSSLNSWFCSRDNSLTLSLSSLRKYVIHSRLSRQYLSAR